MRAGRGKLVRRLLGYAWLSLLGVALMFSGISAERQARQTPEYPCCCDPFGYLQSAQDIRHARTTGTIPQFTIETSHTRLLIELMKSRQVPLHLWEDLVAPLAYHYFPGTDRVGVQYPPGTGLVLSLYPEDKALRGLARVVVVLFVASGLVMLVVAAAKRTWLSAGFFVLALAAGLDILGNIDNASFSVNAMLTPLLLSGLSLSCAYALRERSGRLFYLAWLLALLAGVLFGFAVLIRLPVLFLLPGILVLLWPSKLRRWYKTALLAFLLGALLGGAVPLAIHQSRMTGAWYSSTYPRYDTTPPALEYVRSNFAYYFGPGKARPFYWALPGMLIGCLGLFVWTRGRGGADETATFFPRLSWPRLITAALLMWGGSLAYFLTHLQRSHYYPVQATFATVLLLGMGAFALESQRLVSSGNQGRLWRKLQIVALALALIPGLVVIIRPWFTFERRSTENPPPPFVLPAELADERAWIWAGHLSGTIWYYTRKPAHKIASSDGETRAMVYEFVRSRGEPQYLIGDDPGMLPVEDEIRRFGGRLELRGKVVGYSYYLIRWPFSGPVKFR